MCSSYLFVLGSGDDFVLELFGHVVEVVGVASHPDEQVSVLVGMFLCIE